MNNISENNDLNNNNADGIPKNDNTFFWKLNLKNIDKKKKK